MYYTSQGVPQDYQEALKWFRQAAEQGFAQAQYNLGVMYGKGQGVPQSDAECYAWILLAASNGLEEASKLKALFSQEMNASQIAAAEQRAKEIQAELGRKKGAAP